MAMELWDALDGAGGLLEQLNKDPSMKDRVNDLSWMKSFFILMQFIDGPSLVRAIRLFPQDPWQVFEPQKFGFYRDTWMTFVNGRMKDPEGKNYITSTDGFKYGIAKNGKFGDGTSADAWAQRQLTQVLPRLSKDLSGRPDVVPYRDEEVRAGGDMEGRTFVATPGQVKAMQANPYLVVNAAAQPDGNYFVYYYYPDPAHLNPALKSRVSPQLWADMTASTYAGADDPKFKAHCKQLIQDLVLDMFKRHYGQAVAISTDSTVKDGLSIILDMVSIHPFTDYNGRTTRFYLAAAIFESAVKVSGAWQGGAAPSAFISDFDLVTPKGDYAKQVLAGTSAVANLRAAMVAEFIKAASNPSYGPPKHFDLPAWEQFPNDALAWARGSTNVAFGAGDWDTIRTRNFVPLLDSKLGKNWPTRN